MGALFLERIDRVYTMHRAWTHQDFGDKLPSQVFLERIALCFIDDGFGVESRHKLNLDMVTWECDYPHSDSTWPLAPNPWPVISTECPTARSTKSPTRMRCAFTALTCSLTYPSSRPPSELCAPRHAMSTSGTGPQRA